MWTALAAYALDQANKNQAGKGGTAGDLTGGTSEGKAAIDFSGFTAATGSAKAYGATIKKGAGEEDGLGALAEAAPGALMSPVGLLILGGLGLVAVWSIARNRK